MLGYRLTYRSIKLIVHHISLVRPCWVRCIIHFRGKFIVTSKFVPTSTNTSFALRTRALHRRATTIPNRIDMAVGAFEPVTFRHTHSLHNVDAFLSSEMLSPPTRLPTRSSRVWTSSAVSSVSGSPLVSIRLVCHRNKT